jgi:TPR repeat protein
MYQLGLGVDSDPETAERLFTKSAKQLDPVACILRALSAQSMRTERGFATRARSIWAPFQRGLSADLASQHGQQR